MQTKKADQQQYGDRAGGRGRSGAYEGARGNLGHDRYLHNLDHDDGFISVTFQIIKTYKIIHLKYM